jgi:hypothetical protein
MLLIPTVPGSVLFIARNHRNRIHAGTEKFKLFRYRRVSFSNRGLSIDSAGYTDIKATAAAMETLLFTLSLLPHMFRRRLLKAKLGRYNMTLCP